MFHDGGGGVGPPVIPGGGGPAIPGGGGAPPNCDRGIDNGTEVDVDLTLEGDDSDLLRISSDEASMTMQHINKHFIIIITNNCKR